jgi:hypothetical protein
VARTTVTYLLVVKKIGEGLLPRPSVLTLAWVPRPARAENAGPALTSVKTHAAPPGIDRPQSWLGSPALPAQLVQSGWITCCAGGLALSPVLGSCSWSRVVQLRVSGRSWGRSHA